MRAAVFSLHHGGVPVASQEITAEGSSTAGATPLSMGRPFQARLGKVFGYLRLQAVAS